MATPLVRTRTLSRLREELDGRVLVPGDAGYEEARRVFVSAVDRRPAAVARPADAAEVAAVVAYACDGDFELAVRSGGHSSAGHGTTDGGIVLDLSRLKQLEVAEDACTAWAGAGATAGEVTAALAQVGRVVGFGDTASVGIGGLTLGGGIGLLVRRDGLTVDNLLAAEIVTADGRVLHVGGETEPDLLWAIRGGGGNFGVVTRFRYRLRPLETVTGGPLVLPAAGDTVASFVAAANAAPDDVSAIANVLPAPPLPFLPAEQHGRLVLMATIVHAGEPRAAEGALAPFRSIAQPLADLVRPTPYPALLAAENGAPPRAAFRTLFTDDLGAADAAGLLERLQTSRAQAAVVQLRVLGGAVSRVPEAETAYAHRARRILANVAAVYGAADEEPLHEAWVAETAAALRRGEDAAYVNFLGDEGPARVRAAYPGPTWERLAEVKRRYDPQNVFRLNQNVPPSGEFG